ncbi:MAG: ATP synthase F1 subunit gamma [Endomicrobiales bacterium]
MAAENLNTIKRRIKTAVNISQIAKAMEMISASKIRRAKESVENNRPYADKITSILERILGALEIAEIDNRYLKAPAGAKKLVIAVSPDRGLCGALPDNLFRKLLGFSREDVELITVGKKMERFALRAGFRLVATFPMGTTLPAYSFIYPLIDIVTRRYLGGEVAEVSLLYAEFQSFFSQAPVVRRLLPVTLEAKRKEKEEIVYTFEPGIEEVLTELLPYYVEVELYHALLNAFTSEQAARMMSMQNAKNNALDIRDDLTLSYNKLRQSKITGEILDITNSRFA